MSETGSNFLAEIAQKVAASDAKADADLADILAGRPFKRAHPPKAVAGETVAAAPKKPRARRAPAKKKPAPTQPT